LAPTVGHETNTFSTRFSLKMVSTHSRAGANKQADAGPSGPLSITPDLATILDGQAKMQQELADMKKRSSEEMEALRQENSRLRRRIEADPNLKGKAKETSEAVKSLAFQPTEEEVNTIPPSHLHHHPTDTRYLYPSPSLSIWSTGPYRTPNPRSHLPHHPYPLQHTHRTPHHTYSTL